MPHPGEYLRLHPLLRYRHAKTKKYDPNERTDKTPKIELSSNERANPSHAEFKTLVIRMLTEMVEYGHKIEEKVKAMKSEIKGTNSGGKEIGTQINSLGQKEEINIHPEQNEETRIQKNEDSLRNLWDNFKNPTSKS